MATTKKLKPAGKMSAAEVADELYATRAARYKANREAELYKERESELKVALLAYFKKSKGRVVGGKVARVTLETEQVAMLEDDVKFYAFVKKTGAFDLLQRRLSADAVKQRFEAGKPVPGVKMQGVAKFSVEKLKS